MPAMDFAMLPPEINSARMYSGAGAAPTLAAAASWDALATELQAMAAGYETVIAELSTEWSGPSATTMAAAATPYAEWLRATGAQAEQTATQAKAAAAAYATAFAMTVPPPAVAANRSQLAALLATNVVGQNTAAIAATEAQYAQMWAQDASAMYNYAGSAAAAARLMPFSQPPQTTNPAGSAAQAGATGQTAAAAAGSHAQTVTATLTQALQGLASPAAAAAAPNASGLLSSIAPAAAIEPALAASYLGLAASLFGTFVIDAAGTFGVDVAGSFGIDLIGVGEIDAELGPLAELVSSVTPVNASLGEAAAISGLSVPPAWTAAIPSAIQQVGGALPAVSAAAVAAGETTLPFAEMATAGLAGRASAALGRGARGGSGRAGGTTRTRSAPRENTPRSPVQSSVQPPVREPRPATGPITRISGELRELADLRDAGILTEEEFTEEKRRLLGR